ncbi:hypothetical protein EPUS_00438 [Endocarpon pusillum Z07020]|uniref:Something about silencing protein 4 domain-containing protein n=1 Tax=Endocarpon pusillum (strain Z07020 / HMAS-L-300199) TaxID=1263415 RepID=U1HJ68_ENDPU|nr:uncharacterized protein EPUS_00438 [Endocarpon pusillum Z07020]ERF70250.1 hypothetical protein EPUS_00438 [Endocarpon pusillum Z07020]
MVARSQPSLRRSSRRGDQAPSAAPVTDTQPPSTVTLSHRTKRSRLSSLSEAESLRKKQKTEHFGYPSEYKFPLRNRPYNEPSRSLPLKNGTKPVSSGHERETSALCIAEQKHPEQQHTSQSNDKRTLRSQDGGSRSKSELSLYFTNYDQMLSLEHAEPDLLAAGTHITLINDLSIPSEESSSPLASTILKTEDPDPFGSQKPLHNAQRVELNSALPTHSPRRLIKDTLSEDIFYRAHRKAERHEKQLRNIEKERAQHEKVQLDRLLEELRGPDWLKVMGISGVTESEKKLYEPKRVFFIREVAGLIEKFRHWKEEEKRRKIEREQALLAEEEEEDEHFGSQDDKDGPNGSGHQPSSPTLPAPPDTNDVDAAAARQLHQEAKSASSSSSTKPRMNKPPNGSSNPYPSHPGLPTHLEQSSSASLTAKTHRRNMAVTGHRHGRGTTAFGEPVPDLQEREFKLPATILTKDMLSWRAYDRMITSFDEAIWWADFRVSFIQACLAFTSLAYLQKIPRTHEGLREFIKIGYLTGTSAPSLPPSAAAAAAETPPIHEISSTLRTQAEDGMGWDIYPTILHRQT